MQSISTIQGRDGGAGGVRGPVGPKSGNCQALPSASLMMSVLVGCLALILGLQACDLTHISFESGSQWYLQCKQLDFSFAAMSLT